MPPALSPPSRCASHLVLLETGDDSLDWTDGFQGTVQYVYIQSAGNERGIEADNRDPSKFPVTNEPVSRPMVYNLTINGAEKNGAHLRRGTGATIVNSVIVNTSGCGIYTDLDAATVSADSLNFHNIVFFNNAEGSFCPVEDATKDGDAESFSKDTWEADPMLNKGVPQAGSPALDATKADATVSNFLGAFGTENWAAGWSSIGTL